eukprot:SAG31_NODE_3288_length_4459_cov_30.078440_3_plen_309_part_00
MVRIGRTTDPKEKATREKEFDDEGFDNPLADGQSPEQLSSYHITKPSSSEQLSGRGDSVDSGGSSQKTNHQWHLRDVTLGILAAQSFSRALEEKRKAATILGDDEDGDGKGTSKVSSSVNSGTNEFAVPPVVMAAADGDMETLARLIADMPTKTSRTAAQELDETVIPHGPDAGQNALIKAVRNNQKRCVKVLLVAGADPLLADAKYRSAWYYACFGVNIPKGQHKDMVRILTMREGADSITPEVVLCSCFTRNEGVTWSVLDSLRCEVTSKDSSGNCEFLFHDLDVLDNPLAVNLFDFQYSLAASCV